MKKIYMTLLAEARKLEKHIDTDWAYENESKYEDFENKIEDAYAKGTLTAAEFDALASIAFYDYPEGLKGDYDDETFIAEVMALAQPISEYHRGTCRAGAGPREEDKMKRIERIEIHRKEGKNNIVKTEYRIYTDPVTYSIKTKSQLTKAEKEFLKNNKAKEVFHF